MAGRIRLAVAEAATIMVSRRIDVRVDDGDDREDGHGPTLRRPPFEQRLEFNKFKELWP